MGKAAVHPPALAVLSHTPDRATQTIAWVGKGIVYDTGGLSIKGKVRWGCWGQGGWSLGPSSPLGVVEDSMHQEEAAQPVPSLLRPSSVGYLGSVPSGQSGSGTRRLAGAEGDHRREDWVKPMPRGPAQESVGR